MPVHPGSTPVWDIVGIGANSVDFVNLLPAVPQPQGPHAKMRIRRQIISCGGQMTTAMACCARLGLRAKYVGVTGTDENGRRIRAEMAHHQVDMSDAVIRDVPNQFAVIMVDESTGERIVLWDRDERLRCARVRCRSMRFGPRAWSTWTMSIRGRRLTPRAPGGKWACA